MENMKTNNLEKLMLQSREHVQGHVSGKYKNQQLIISEFYKMGVLKYPVIINI